MGSSVPGALDRQSQRRMADLESEKLMFRLLSGTV